MNPKVGSIRKPIKLIKLLVKIDQEKEAKKHYKGWKKKITPFIDCTEVKGMTECYEQVYANKFDNPDKRDNFLERLKATRIYWNRSQRKYL